jgi:polyhydroxyalkanoate synthase
VTRSSSPLDQLRALADKARGAIALATRRAPICPTPGDVVYRSNKLRLLRYRAPAAAARTVPTPIVMVPSLINRYYILDLMPGRSVVEHLVGRGFDVFMIDWGRPGAEDRWTTLDEHIAGLLDRCVRRASELAGSPRASLLGYCMGGTLAAIYAALRPERVQALVALTAPFDFAHAGLLGQWAGPRYLDADLVVDSLGNVPWPLLQATFLMLVPTMTAHKLLYLYDRITDDDFRDHFLSLETWGNDNVSFPGECFRRYVKDLYQRNLLVAGELAIDGEPARLPDIRCPVLTVVAQGDHVVPEAAATALHELVGSTDRTLWRRPGGHLGAIVSKTAGRELLPGLAAWLAERS